MYNNAIEKTYIEAARIEIGNTSKPQHEYYALDIEHFETDTPVTNFSGDKLFRTRKELENFKVALR